MESPHIMTRLRPFFIVVDLGFILYWAATAFHVLPPEYLYSDYTNPMLVAWNWSFMPLDLLVSATGLAAVYFWQKQDRRYQALALLSLAFTTASGLQAISYWAIRGEFDWIWWLPNLFLLIYPLFFISHIMLAEDQAQL